MSFLGDVLRIQALWSDTEGQPLDTAVVIHFSSISYVSRSSRMEQNIYYPFVYFVGYSHTHEDIKIICESAFALVKSLPPLDIHVAQMVTFFLKEEAKTQAENNNN
jgi:hypothetical protein